MTMQFDDIRTDETCRVEPHIRQATVYTSYLKRALDFTLIVISAPLVLPIVAIFSLLVALSGGSPFYSQPRIGRCGKIFQIWKIRSMVANADDLLVDYLAQNPEARAEWDATQKLKSDPRITRVGKLIRKCSIDELPQLWNVITGDMSLVGPRPMMPSQAQYYGGSAYYQLRPGLTGLWQVSDRNDCNFSVRADYDEKYAANISFATDATIIVRTVGVVVSATGY